MLEASRNFFSVPVYCRSIHPFILNFNFIVCAVELGRSCTSNDNFRARRAKVQHTAGKFLDGSSISAVPLLEQLDHPLTIARASRRVRGPLQRVPAFVARRDARVSATREQFCDDVLAVVLLTQRARMLSTDAKQA